MKIKSSWIRELWGVTFRSRDNKPTLIGGLWEPKMFPRYENEPSRTLLFCTRRFAKKWCLEENAQYRKRGGDSKYWHFSPVKVIEIVEVLTQMEREKKKRSKA